MGSKLEFLFCFQKVDFFTKSNTNTTDNEEPHKDELTDNKQCKVDELTDELKKLDAEFKDQSTCQPGKSIESTETCKAFCKPGYAKVSPTTYTCSNGTWEKPEAIVCKPIKLATCKVDAALEKLKGLDAEFKEEKCQEGKKLRRRERAKLLAKMDSKEIRCNTLATTKESSLQKWKFPAEKVALVNSEFSSLYFACLLSIKQKNDSD